MGLDFLPGRAYCFFIREAGHEPGRVMDGVRLGAEGRPLSETRPAQITGRDGPMLKLSNLKKSYLMGETSVLALKGIDLHIRRNEFVAVMGASGSGKSTLMNILGCLDKPTEGSYVLNGKEVSRLTTMSCPSPGTSTWDSCSRISTCCRGTRP